MSFVLSDDEEDFDEWFSSGHRREAVNDNTSKVQAEAAWPLRASPENGKFAGSSDEEGEDDDDDDDDIEWEDAVDLKDDGTEPNDSGETLDTKPPAFDMAKLKPVSLDLGEAPSNTTDDKKDAGRKKTRKRKRILRNKSLPQDLASLLQNLHQCHLLCLASSVSHVSSQCSDEEILGVAGSLLPPQWALSVSNATPSLLELNNFLQEWYLLFVHDTPARRRQRRQENAALGAPVARRRRGRSARSRISVSCLVDRLQEYSRYLAWETGENVELLPIDDDAFREDHRLKSLLLVALARSMGWRARVVQALEPMKRDMDEEHPLMVACTNIFSVGSKKRNSRRGSDYPQPHGTADVSIGSSKSTDPLVWTEILVTDGSNTQTGSNSNKRWIHVDPQAQLFDAPHQVPVLLRKQQQQSTSSSASTHGKRKALTVAYVLAVEHRSVADTKTTVRLTDVTPRYTSSWAASLRARGFELDKRRGTDSLRDEWWSNTLHDINHKNSCQSRGRSKHDAIDVDSDQENNNVVEEDAATEAKELQELAIDEAIPTSKVAFQTHPIYVIPSVLGKCEVLAPDAKKRICGIFKGQIVYRRSDVSTALPAAKWPYQGRRVLQAERKNPIKQVKARKKPVARGFKALKSYGVGEGNDGGPESTAKSIVNGSASLEDGMNDLYAIWQTEPWNPPAVGPQDPIPTNEHRNVELALINPGLVHVDGKGLAKVAKQLGIPYAPCLVGFEGHAGNRTPTIRGIVVHQHSQQLIREAGVEVESNAVEIEISKHRREILLRWKRLMVNLLTKERLEREYGRKPDESE